MTLHIPNPSTVLLRYTRGRQSAAFDESFFFFKDDSQNSAAKSLNLYCHKLYRVSHYFFSSRLSHSIYIAKCYTECLTISFEVGCHSIYIAKCYTECLTISFEVGSHSIYIAKCYTECLTISFEVG